MLSKAIQWPFNEGLQGIASILFATRGRFIEVPDELNVVRLQNKHYSSLTFYSIEQIARIRGVR